MSLPLKNKNHCQFFRVRTVQIVYRSHQSRFHRWDVVIMPLLWFLCWWPFNIPGLIFVVVEILQSITVWMRDIYSGRVVQILFLCLCLSVPFSVLLIIVFDFVHMIAILTYEFNADQLLMKEIQHWPYFFCSDWNRTNNNTVTIGAFHRNYIVCDHENSY